MKINIKNTSKLVAAIAATEIKARVRRITPSDIVDIARRIENRLASLNVPKNKQIGMKFHCGNPEKFPNCYKGRPESTNFDLERMKSGWFITDIRRSDTKGQEAFFRNESDYQKFYLFYR